MDTNKIKSKSVVNQIINGIVELDKAVEERKYAYEILNRDYPQEKLTTDRYETHKIRQQSIQENFNKDWNKALIKLDELCKRVRNRQPHLSKLRDSNINKTNFFPDGLAFGRLKLCYENWSGYIPRLIPFPFTKGISLSNEKGEYRWIHQLLLRMMTAIPIEYLQIIACDPLDLGNSLKPLLPLLEQPRPFVEKRILTKSDEIELVLLRELDYIESLLQKKFKGSISNWLDYNEQTEGKKLHYKVLLVLNIPEQLTDKSLWYLGRIMEHGPKCGILPILTIDEEAMQHDKYKDFKRSINFFTEPIGGIISGDRSLQSISNIEITQEQEFWPEIPRLDDIIQCLCKEYASSGAFKKELRELWDPSTLWKECSAEGLIAPIGWTDDGKVCEFILGRVDSEHHALLAGRSGSGKSNLLHVIIHSLCHRYSSSELNIFLLDYKQGTEFNTYANPPIPQAALVATESDPEYGTTVLKHIEIELEKRAEEFKSYSVRDVLEYRKKTGEELPRILLIIDEFQLLFSENSQVGAAAEKSLNVLLRQGRAFGIHVLLATQTLKGIQSLSMSQLISQIGCRIALACGEEDSAMILGSNNWAAAALKSPPEGIINNSNGARSGNRKFLIPYAEQIVCQEHLVMLYNLSIKLGYINKTTVFNGAHLPNIPEEQSLKLELDYKPAPSLILGQELNFKGNKFYIDFDDYKPSNLLIAGYDPFIHDGLLISALLSLNNSKLVDKILYFNARSRELPAFGQVKNNERFITKGIDWDGDFKELLGQNNGSYNVLIIDGLENAKVFHSSVTFGKPKTEGAPEVLRKVLEASPQDRLIVIVFVENWRRGNNLCKDLFNNFELRIGFQLSEDDAGTFVSGNFGKLKGLEQANKAIFVDKLRNQQIWFRPFANKKS